MFGLSTAATLAVLFVAAMLQALAGQLGIFFGAGAGVFRSKVFRSKVLVGMGGCFFVTGALTGFGFVGFLIYTVVTLLEKAAG